MIGHRPALPPDPRELALLADLVAAALDAGAPLHTALSTADAAVPGPRRHLLGLAARDLLDGRSVPTTGPATLRTEEPDGDEPLPPSFVRALHRSGRSGARLAAVLRLLADDLRAEAAAAELERARRVGVLAVIPLGLCCLPAFMLLAVVPLAAGLLRGVLS
jgi:Flp pilus assembly protein TadB